MKISIDQKFPGYDPAKARLAEIYLDGEKLTTCVAADSDKGTAECFARDRRGNFFIRNGETAIETRRGNVCIVLSDEACP